LNVAGQRSVNCLTHDRFDKPEPMTTFSSRTTGVPGFEHLSRKPQRITITLSWAVLNRLQQRSDAEGRSLSNLAAHLLEVATAG
jgi:hypothetical protein